MVVGDKTGKYSAGISTKLFSHGHNGDLILFITILFNCLHLCNVK